MYERRPNHLLLLVSLANLLVLVSIGHAEELRSIPENTLGNGSIEVCWKPGYSMRRSHLVVHFHGSAKTVKAAFQRSNFNAVLVIVNFPGLSTAYSKPFADDKQLFRSVFVHADHAIRKRTRTPLDAEQWQRVSVSMFSAGYGAVREILKTPENFALIDDVFSADSIYAGLDASAPQRIVDEANMKHFLQFAQLAVARKKAFIAAHSSQSTPYASTTETAGYLLNALQVRREANEKFDHGVLQQRTLAKRGNFIVMGFDGTSAKQHMAHLHHIDLLWNQLAKTQD